jgi:hypothetical protein
MNFFKKRSELQRSNKEHAKLAKKAKNMGLYKYHNEVIKRQNTYGRILSIKERQRLYEEWL